MIRSIQNCLARYTGAIAAFAVLALCAVSPDALALTSQTITFGTISTQSYGTTLTLSATASSGLTVTFSSTTTSVCTVSGSVVSYVNTGNCTIAANQAGNATYAAAPQVTRSFSITTGTQTVNFTPIGNVTYGIAPITMSASDTAGTSITFSGGTASVCNVSASTLTIVGAGNCTVSAQGAPNQKYTTATASQTFTVSGESQTVTFPALSNLNMGSTETAAATASSSLTVQYSSLTSSVCTINPGGVITPVAIGLCTIAANQSGNSSVSAAAQVTQSFNVLGKAQTITFAALSNKAYGSAAFTVSATASSSLAISYSSGTTGVCTISGSTVTIIAGGLCSITASQAGNSTYAAATPVTQSFTVTQLSQSISFGALGGKAYGSAPFSVSATASSGLAVTFTSGTTGVCTVSGSTVTIVGIGNCTINANQAGNADYSAASQVGQTFAVSQAAQSISFTAPANVAYGASAVALNAAATSGLTVSYSTTTTGVCTISGSSAIIVAPGTCSVTASQAGNTNYAAATSVTQNFSVTQASESISFTAPSGVVYGASPVSLSATATSGLAVSFSSSTTGVCTVSGNSLTVIAAGTCTIVASQPGNADYAAATAVTQNFSIGQATQSISFATLPNKILGQSAFTVSATSNSGLTVSFASSTPSICTISGTTVTLAAAGNCTIVASQAGNANYAAAANVSQGFTVSADVAPSVSITSPTAGQSFSAPASITLTANASSSDATITQVQFYNGSTPIGSATQAPYNVTWSNVATGSYSVTAVATDNLGTSTTSAAVAVTVSNPITVTLTSPNAGQTYYASSPITLTATVGDSNAAVTQVAFYNGSNLLGTVTQAPYSINVPNLPVGNYSFTAVATDNASQSGTSAPVAVAVLPLTTDPNLANVQLLLHMDGANGSTTFTDVMGHPMTANNGAQISTAQSMFGGASMTTQNTGYVSTPAAPELALGGNDFTIELWAYATNLSAGCCGAGLQTMISQNQFGTSAGSVFNVFLINGNVAAGVTNGLIESNTPMPLNTWSHIAFVGQGNTITLYLNGQSIGSTSRGAAPAASTLPITIGADAVGNGVFNGYIDEVRFTNGLARYTGNFTPAGPFPNTGGQTQNINFPLPAQATVGSTSALVATSSSGGAVTFASTTPAICSVSGNNLTMLGLGTCYISATQSGSEGYADTQIMATIESVQAAPAPTADPYVGDVQLLLHMDGTNGSTTFTDVMGHSMTANNGAQISMAQWAFGGASMATGATGYLSTPAAPELAIGNNDFTAEMWVYQTNASAGTQYDAWYQSLFMQQQFGTSAGATLGIWTRAGVVYAGLSGAAGSQIQFGATTPLVPDTWNHIAFVGQGSNLTLYINGQSAATAQRSGTVPVSTLPITIGADAVGNGVFAGYIDEVRYTNGVARYSANFTPAGPYPNSGNQTQTISFSAVFDAAAGTSLTLQASASSGLAVTFSTSTPAICSISGNTLTPLAAGNCLINANQSGNITYLAAAQVTQTINIVSQGQGIAFPPLSAQALNQQSVTVSAYATSGQSVTYTSNTPTVCSTSGATVTLLSAGTCTIIATSPGSTSASQSFSVTAANAPTITITSPSAGQNYPAPGSLTLSASAVDNNAAIAQVQYFSGATLIGSATQAPYSVTWNNVPAGSYSIVALATDGNGISSTSAPITISVGTVPTVSLAAPANGGQISGKNLTLSATASETGGTIIQVAFYNGSALLGTTTQAPYSLTFPDLDPGSYSFTAQATDSSGNTVSSAIVNVTVLPEGAGGPTPGAQVVYDVHTDHLGTPRMVTDSNKNIVWQWDNGDAFGNNLPNQSPNGGSSFVFNLRFGGWQYYDVETGLFYNYFRDYDPATGRFPQSDPIGLNAGQFSTYTYVDGNPLAYYDPFGLQSTPEACAEPQNVEACQAADILPPKPKPAPVPIPIPPKPEPRKRSAWDVVVEACKKDLPKWWPASDSGSRERCEQDCDKDYDARQDFCRAMSGMKGRKKQTFSQCMQAANEAYIACYQDCGK